MKNRIKRFLFRALCGFFLGLSVIAPGISGSILAVMMGIYEKLIGIAANPFKGFRRNFVYLFPMGIGALVSVGLFIKLLDFAFDVYPTQSTMLLMGLIAGGLLEISRRIRAVKFKWSYLIGIIISLSLVLATMIIDPAEVIGYAGPISFWYLCIAGGLAGVAGIIPGMSVSMIMMLLGVYNYLLHTASGFASDFPQFVSMIIPFGISFVVCMVLFSRLVKLVFDRYPGFAYYMVLGFTIGTLIAIFPGLPLADAGALAACALLFIAGLLISAGIQFLGKKLSLDHA